MLTKKKPTKAFYYSFVLLFYSASEQLESLPNAAEAVQFPPADTVLKRLRVGLNNFS